MKVLNDRWAVSASDFAVRVIVPDPKGFFENLPLIKGGPKARSLVIEPGTRALVIEEGFLVGEVPAGEYTLESFVERLQFWRQKQCTLFLTRCEDVPLTSQVSNVPSLEGVCFDLSCRWTVQISDIMNFMQNLMGAREELPLSELQSLLDPMVRQGIYSTVGRKPYDELKQPGLSALLADGLRSEIDVRFQRYGLQFIDLQHVEASCDDGGLGQREGELWLRGRQAQLLQAASDVADKELSAQVGDIQSKLPLRDELRKAIASDRLGKIKTKEEFADVLLEIDKGKLLRQEERDALIAAYEEKKEDREQLREHLLATLDLHREQELGELRVDMDYAVRSRSLERELELARLSQTSDAEQWRHELEQEKEQAAHRREQKHESVRAHWNRVREARQQRREDSWETILHEQKMEEVRQDLEIARAERGRKVALMQSELKSRLESDKLEVQKRQQEQEQELRSRKADDKLGRLQRLQEMNAQFAERQHRMQVEMETLRADSESKRELDRINAMSQLNTEALVATAATDNAALLADLKKHEATQEAAKAHAAADPAAQLNEERLRMYERMNETERAKADAIADAYKTAMQSQQGSVQQMIGGLAQAATPQTPATPTAAPVAETWHVSLSGQQSPPLQLAQVQQYIQGGQVNPSTMVWKTGMANWAPAGQVPELAGLLPPAAGPPPSPGPAAPPGPPPA